MTQTYLPGEVHNDKRWTECRYPGCHRNVKAKIHSHSGYCTRCHQGGHPYWIKVVSVAQPGRKVGHHFFLPPSRASVITGQVPMPNPEGMEFD